MATYTNNTRGMRGINLKGGGIAWIEPGASVDLDDGDIVGALPDLGKDGDLNEQTASSLAEALAIIDDLKAQLAALQKPKLPGLTGKSKDQLLAIAADEGVTIPDGATNNDIVAAIELNREAI
jgi:hypothetical protein